MKKSSQLLIICAFLLSSAIQAQWKSNQKVKGNGNVISEKRTTAEYERISVTGFFDVELVYGKEGNITVKGEENLLPHIKIAVVNQELTITTDKNKYISTSNGQNITITVPFESINQVSLTGSGDISTKNTIKSDSFAAKLTGSGDLKLNVEAKDIEVNLNGSGDIVLIGKTDSITSTLNGSGDIKATEMKSKNARVTVSGSGDCSVFCSESMYARVSGSGEIKYSGNPEKKDTKVNGSGEITKS